ncbi:MAG: 1-deoxy-D-xylulose-5-phosphate reductoisomerase [Rikenellaceae bacterium]|nr:1-deoxy-D-xylulose-5-phosphate reductoisomerase [Rikenellaceae bacterium]
MALQDPTAGMPKSVFGQKRLAVFGSTGSIGTQTLDIIRRFPDRFKAVVLTSNTRWKELALQAAEFLPEYAVIADSKYGDKLRSALSGIPVKVLTGSDNIARIAGECDADIVVNALVGFSGLMPTVETLRSGKTLALANKESLVAGGEHVMRLGESSGAKILPVDSEHSAILQCLTGETAPVKKIILTASGGALREVPVDRLDRVTVRQALSHPNWEMGAKITIDSATMVNKGFEVIEARWLFGLAASQIEVVIHPQSVVHSMVEFADGALKAQLGTPDMHLPIQYALTYPERWETPAGGGFNIADLRELTFFEPDAERYPVLSTAYAVLEQGGDRGCVLNAANEAAVGAFLDGRIGFRDITRTIDHCLYSMAFSDIGSLDDIILCNEATIAKANEYISSVR